MNLDSAYFNDGKTQESALEDIGYAYPYKIGQRREVLLHKLTKGAGSH